jgi:hypothetical protein
VTTFFSTGNTIPRTRIAGTVFDWVSGSPAAGALIESFVPPDSAHAYIAVADSNGGFLIEHMPPTTYVLRAYVDRNRNQGIDPSEPWDSTSINVTDSAKSVLVLFVHDTLRLGPRRERGRFGHSASLSISRSIRHKRWRRQLVISPDSAPHRQRRATAKGHHTCSRPFLPLRPCGDAAPAVRVPGRADPTQPPVAKPVMPAHCRSPGRRKK